MSLSCMGAVKLCGPREMAPYVVLLMIADEADDYGVAIVSHEKLAESSRCDVRSIIRSVDKLEAAGWVCVRRRLWKDKCNVYFLNLPKIGVTLSPDAKLSGFHASLRKMHGDRLSPVFRDPEAVTEIPTPPAPEPVQKPVEPFFSPEPNGDSGEFSGDIPQAAIVTAERGMVTNEAPNGDKLCHPSHCPVVNPVEDGPAENAVPDSPLPPSGGCVDLEASASVENHDGDAFAIHAAAESDFTLLKARLKQELLGQPRTNFFRELKPGENDYDACFRDWWFDRLDIVAADRIWKCRTSARDSVWTRVGLAKYQLRLERLARAIFHVPRGYEVRFELTEQEDLQQCA